MHLNENAFLLNANETCFSTHLEMIKYFVLKYCLMYGPAFMVTYINYLNVILFETYLCHILVLIKLRNICEIGLLYQ